MTFDWETRAWLAFAGSAFALMGVNLAAGAEGHAASAADWPGSTSRSVAALVAAYRAAGSAFGALGAALIAGAWLGPRGFAALGRPIHLSAPQRLAAGAVLAAAGAGLAYHRLTLAAPRRLPACLDDGLLSGDGPTLRRRAASAAAWLLSADFLLFGCFLLSRRGGLNP